MVTRGNGVDLRQALRRATVGALRYGEHAGLLGGGKAIRIVDDDLLLGAGLPVIANGRHERADAQAVEEESITAAQHRLGRCAFAVAVKRIGKSDARTPVVMIGNVILRFPAYAVRESEVLGLLPVILEKQRRVKNIAPRILVA